MPYRMHRTAARVTFSGILAGWALLAVQADAFAGPSYDVTDPSFNIQGVHLNMSPAEAEAILIAKLGQKAVSVRRGMHFFDNQFAKRRCFLEHPTDEDGRTACRTNETKIRGNTVLEITAELSATQTLTVQFTSMLAGNRADELEFKANESKLKVSEEEFASQLAGRFGEPSNPNNGRPYWGVTTNLHGRPNVDPKMPYMKASLRQLDFTIKDPRSSEDQTRLAEEEALKFDNRKNNLKF